MDSKSYTLIKNAENSIFFIPCDEIERFEPLHNAFEKGIRLTSYDANDYSLYNRESEAEKDMKEAGSKIFGEAFKDLEYEDNYCNDYLSELDCNFNFLNLEEIGLSSEEDAIRDFIKNWEKDNSIYATGDFFTYWNGHNHNSIILRQEGDFRPEFEELDEEESLPILKAFRGISDWEEIKPGIKVAYNNGYKFTESSWDGHIGAYECIELDKEERKALAEEEFGLNSISTTSDLSGYPTQMDTAVIGFDSFDEVRRCGEKYGLKAGSFMKKDGWNLWYREGSVYEEFAVSAEDFGDDYSSFDKDCYLERLKEEVNEASCFEDIKAKVDMAEKVYDAVEDLEEDETVVLRGLDLYMVTKAKCLRKSLDNRTYEIGLE